MTDYEWEKYKTLRRNGMEIFSGEIFFKNFVIGRDTI